MPYPLCLFLKSRQKNPVFSAFPAALQWVFRACQDRQSGQYRLSALLKLASQFYPKRPKFDPKTTPLTPQNTPTSSNFLQLFGPHRHKCAHPNRYILPILTHFFSFPAPRSRPPPPFLAQKRTPPGRTFACTPVKGPVTRLNPRQPPFLKTKLSNSSPPACSKTSPPHPPGPPQRPPVPASTARSDPENPPASATAPDVAACESPWPPPDGHAHESP